MKKLFFGLCAAALSVCASDIFLVRNGKAEAEIVLPEKAPGSVQLAAYELNAHIQLITGVKLPVSAKASGKYKTVIELGTKPEKFKEEYSAVEVAPGKIRIYGYDAPFYGKVDYNKHSTFAKGSAGTLFAAYDFLEKFCGVRWYAPGKYGTVYSRSKDLAVKTGKSRIVSKTASYRRLSPMPQRYLIQKFYGCSLRDMALHHLRWRTFAYSPGDHHNIYPIYYEYYAPAERDPELRAIFKERRPEFFAKGYDGVMAPVDKYVRREYPNDVNLPPGICFSDPGPVKYFANMAIRKYNNEKIIGLPRPYTPRLEGRPFYETISHMDATSLCRCDKCRKRIAEGKSIQWQFIADVANEVAKTHPQINISSGAYQDRAPFPEDVKFPSNIGISIPLGIHAWWNPEFYRIQHDEHYEAWRKRFGGKNMAVWLYIFGPSWDSLTRYKHKYFPGLYPRMAGKIVKKLTNDGVRGCMLEVELEQNTLEAYLACMTFYNPDLDTGKVIDEYFDKYYMESAAEMREFYREIESAYCNWKNYPADMFGPRGAAEKQRLNSLGSGMLTADRNWSIGTEERMAKLVKLFNEAERKASPLVKARLKLLRRAFWDQAVKGIAEHQMRLKNQKTPGKSVVIPRISSAGGDPDKVNWSKAAPMGDCHSLTTGEVHPDAFMFKMAADDKFLYMEMLDKRSVKTSGDRWDNFMEVFLSRDGQMPVAQLGFGINWQTPMAWKLQLINDAVNISGVPPEEVYGANFKLKDEKKVWHWRAAFSLEKLFGTAGVDRFKLNFRRKNPDARLCWNRFFASAQDCLEPGVMGDIIISSADSPVALTFAEGKFKNEVGSWRMLDGFIRFTGKNDEVSCRFTGKKDALICVEKVINRRGEKIELICRSSKPLLATLLGPNGKKLASDKSKWMKKRKDGLYSAEFTPLAKGDSFVVMLCTVKPEDVVLSGVQVKFSGDR